MMTKNNVVYGNTATGITWGLGKQAPIEINDYMEHGFHVYLREVAGKILFNFGYIKEEKEFDPSNPVVLVERDPNRIGLRHEPRPNEVKVTITDIQICDRTLGFDRYKVTYDVETF